MANNTYSTPVINNFDAIKGDTNSPDTLSTEIKHGIQSPLLRAQFENLGELVKNTIFVA